MCWQCSRDVYNQNHKNRTRNVNGERKENMDAKKIGEKLKELRGKRTINEVAQALEISPSALSMYENGERVPRDVIKIKIADYYETPITDIFFI